MTDSKPTGWELEDLEAWDALMDRSSALNALFLDALRKEFAVCIPPDSALGGEPLDEATMRMHILVPSPALRDHYTILGADPSAALEKSKSDDKFAFFKRTPRGPPAKAVPSASPATPRAGATTANGSLVADNKVEHLDAPYPMLRVEGPAWPNGPHDIRILFQDEIRTGDGSAKVFVLDRSLCDSPAGGHAAERRSPQIALFGDSPDDNVMSATDTLFSLDRTGQLMRCINSELQNFRDHYTPLRGYEDDLFARVRGIADGQAKRWVRELGTNFLSRKRSMRSTLVAVNTYVHGRLYQFVFPAVCSLEVEASMEFECGAEAITNSGKSLADFEVPDAIAHRIDMEPLRLLLDRFNVSTTPFDKVQVASRVMDAITAMIERAGQGTESVSADILVPVLAVGLARFPPRDMAAQVSYVERFLPNEALTGADEARSYALVSFRAAVEYIRRYSDESEVTRRLSRVDLHDAYRPQSR
jgi:hypothetical protein